MSIEGIRLTDTAPQDNQLRLQRYEIIGYDEIPVSHISKNPHNPRPSFQLKDDDKYLLELGDSIKTTMQHRPALVFEEVGHYELPDRIGYYRLLQGERRWRACRIAHVDYLRCLTVRTPISLAEELEWLGIEEAFKEEWQNFFLLQFADRLARELNVPILSPDIISRTGLNKDQLQVASKLFRLETPIQKLVQEYEEMSYQVRQGKAKGYKKGEFGANKAAVVYDICVALREFLPQITKSMSDLELQMLVVGKVTKHKNTLDHLQNMLRCIRGEADAPGKQTEVAEFLLNPDRNITQVLKNTDYANVSRYTKLLNRFPLFQSSVESLIPHLGQIGTDPIQLQQDLTAVSRLQRALLQLENGIDAQLRKHGQNS